MAMVTCPYCNMEVSMNSLEAEDGYCPECGAVITASKIFEEEDEDIDELDNEDFEEEEEEKEDEEIEIDEEEIDDKDIIDELDDEDK